MEGWQENHFADQKVGHQEGLTVRSMVGRMEPRSVDPMVHLLVGHQEGRMEPRSVGPMVRSMEPLQEELRGGLVAQQVELAARMEPHSVGPMGPRSVGHQEGLTVRSIEPLQEELQAELAARMEPHSVGLKEHW